MKLDRVYEMRQLLVLTAGLKANSTTVPTGSVMSFGEKVNDLSGATVTCTTREPPAGRPSAGDVLVDAVAAFDL